MTRESGTFDGAGGIGASACSATWPAARPPGHSPRPPAGDLCVKYALVMLTNVDDAVKVGVTGSADTVAMMEANAINVEDADPWCRLPHPPPLLLH